MTEKMEIAIKTIGLEKRFRVRSGYLDALRFKKPRYIEALRGVDLCVPAGGIFGLLGPNGAGKTTLFKLLAGLIVPTEGVARVLDYELPEDLERVKDVLTYVVNEERSLYWRLTGRQNLQFYAALYEIPRKGRKNRVSEVLSIVGLEEPADRQVMYYSTGMKQRLALARGLLSDPEVLLLDEPTRSLDPLSAQSFWRFIREELVYRQGKTVLVATHNLEEARELCDRLAVLHQGRVLGSGTQRELFALLGARPRYSISLFPGAEDGLLQRVRHIPGVLDATYTSTQNGHPASLEVVVEEPESQVPVVVEHVVTSGARLLSCTPVEVSLGFLLAELVKGGQGDDR